MMAKAFQNNPHKRGLLEMTAPPPTPTATTTQQPSSSYLDCQSLQSCLKRVRLSSSPGELRLQRDLRHMVSSGTWVPKQQLDGSSNSSGTSSSGGGELWMWHPPAPPVTARAEHQNPPPHIELQHVESLRLRLTFQHSVVAWIQIPRMYPHKPPLISRIVYNSNFHHHRPNMHHHPCPQGIQSILVHEAHPVPSGDANLLAGGGEEDAGMYGASTVVYRNWSPVQRLGDLLEFVIAMFQKQHIEMTTMPTTSSCINDVSLTYSSSSLSSNSSWSNSRRSSDSSLTSSTTVTTSGYRTSASTVMFPGWIQPDRCLQQAMATDQHSNRSDKTASDLASFLTPNRFDVGYERSLPLGGGSNGMEVDPGIPQQVSMMDL